MKNENSNVISVFSNSHGREDDHLELNARHHTVVEGKGRHMSIFAQAFPVHGGDEGEESSSSVFGPAPVRMKLDKPAANRFILGAVRRAQGTPLLAPSPPACRARERNLSSFNSINLFLIYENE
jgi:hypothetical protein